MILALIKFIDKSLSTLKTITMLKGQYLFSAVLECVSEVIFAYVVVGLVGSKEPLTVLLIALAGGLGKYITLKLNDRYSKEKTYVNVITGKGESKDALIELYQYCKNHSIKCFMLSTYDYEMKPSVAVQIFAETKDDSRLVDNFIEKCGHNLLRKII